MIWNSSTSLIFWTFWVSVWDRHVSLILVYWLFMKILKIICPLLTLACWKKTEVRKSAAVTWRRRGRGSASASSSSSAASVQVPAAPWGKKKTRERRRITVHSSIYGADLRIWCHRIRVSSYGAYMNKSPRKRRRWTVFLGWRKRAVHHCLRRNKNGLDVEGKWGFLFHIHYSQKGEKQEKHIRS